MTKNDDRQVKKVGEWNEHVWYSDYQLSIAFKLNHRKRKKKHIKQNVKENISIKPDESLHFPLVNH